MMNSWRITDKNVRNNAIEALLDVPLDGGITMTLRDSNSRSARQLALMWLLYRAIAKSGVGGIHEANPESIDLKCKYLFALPILASSDTWIADLWSGWHKMHPEKEAAEWFISRHIHISDMSVGQCAEYLTSIYDYYGIRGITLPDPSMYQYELSETE